MKKAFYTLFLLLLVTSAIGCSKPTEKGSAQGEDIQRVPLSKIQEEAKDKNALDENVKNLDLSGTQITIPEVDEIEEVIFPVSTDSTERQVEKFKDNIYRYTGKDRSADLEPFMYVVYADADFNWQEVPFTEVTREQWERIGYLTYNDGAYNASLVFTDYMLTMGQYDEYKRLLGDTENYAGRTFGPLGIDEGTLVRTYRIPQDDISDVVYPLADGDCALSDQIDFVEKQIKKDNYYFVNSEYLDYRVFEVEVRQLNKSAYYYQFNVCAIYKGVTFMKESCVPMSFLTEDSTSENDNSEMGVHTATHYISMFRSGQLGYIYSGSHSYESVKPQQHYTELISLSDACSLLSGHLTESTHFSVGSIQLVYQTDLIYESGEGGELGYVQSIYAHPTYRFTIADHHTPEYEALYFDVDALTGNIRTMIG